VRFGARERTLAALPTKYVFISYSRRDEIVMRRVVAYLRKHGINVWVDNEKLIPGTPIWEAEIEKAIVNATAVIVILSPDSKNSEWVRREISFAEENHKRFFPVLVHGDINSSVTLRLITRQYVDLVKNETIGLKLLRDALRGYFAELVAQENTELETVVRDDAQRMAAEKSALEEAQRLAEEKAAKEKAEHEAAEKAAHEEAQRLAQEKAAKEKAERESAEKVSRAAEIALGMTSPAESVSAQEKNLQEKVAKRPADEVRLPAQTVVEPQAVQTSAPAKFEAKKVENLVSEPSIQTLVEKVAKPDPSKAPQRGFLSQKQLIFVGLVVIVFLVVTSVWAVGAFQKARSANATSPDFLISQNATSTAKVNGTATAAAYKATAAVLEVMNTVRAAQAKSTNSAKGMAISTAEANATPEAQVKAIATENAYFTSSANVSDFFDNNSNKWWTGSADNNYYIGEYTIANGVYQWKVTKTKQHFVSRIDYQGITSNNFDVRVDARRISGITGKSNYGVVFRSTGDNAYYAFQVGDNGFYAVFYYYNNGDNKTMLVDWTENTAIKKNDWNTLRVSAMGKIFDFYINGVHVNRITNDILSSGKFGLFIDFNENETGEVYFDNFYIIKH
jgi:hypothetical protein